MARSKKESLAEHLQEMAAVDIRTVDPSELKDIADVKIQKDLPREERLKDYIQQIVNPYCFLSHGMIVKIGFAGSRSLEECLGNCIAMES